MRLAASDRGRRVLPAATAVAVVTLLAGCAGSRGAGDGFALYRTYLERTAPAPGGAGADAALEAFLAALRDYSPETMRERVFELYAVDAYFNDQIKELVGAAAIRDYLVRSAEMLVQPAIQVQDVAGGDGEYYVRWLMSFRTRRAPDAPPVVARGISHLRFDAEGRVAFHEDFWDVTTAVWERVPVAGALIRRVKASL